MRIFTVKRESGSSLIDSKKLVLSCLRFACGLFVAALAAPIATLHAQAAPAPATIGSQVLCQPQVIGNRRIPKESVLARLFSHQAVLFDPALIERDFNSLWNTSIRA